MNFQKSSLTLSTLKNSYFYAILALSYASYFMLRTFNTFYYLCKCVFVVIGGTVATHLVVAVVRATLKRPSSRRIPREYIVHIL